MDKHVIDLNGRTCNKVGTSFTAFRTQENPCHQDEQSCLYNQPLDLWADDEVCIMCCKMCVCVRVQFALLRVVCVDVCACTWCAYVRICVNSHNCELHRPCAMNLSQAHNCIWYLYVCTIIYHVYPLQYLRQLDKPGHYMMYNYGEIHPTTSADNYSITMRFRHTDFQNSMVTFHIDASDVTYVYSV